MDIYMFINWWDIFRGLSKYQSTMCAYQIGFANTTILLCVSVFILG